MLEGYWAVAKAKFAEAEKHTGKTIGDCPELRYDIRSKRMVGQAQMAISLIRLNPIWLAIENQEVRDAIQADTLVHEICHIIAFKLYGDRGHSIDWRRCMVRMGVLPSRLYTSPLPPYLETKTQLLDAVFAANAGAKELTTDDMPSDNETEIT